MSSSTTECKLRREVFEVATQHGGQYLLPRRTTPDDGQRIACESLVDSGHARWIPFTSSMAPGIRLTGKPIDTP